MATLPPPPPEVAGTGQEASERSLVDMAERIPADLLTAESSHLGGLDDVEHDFWTDPCHFLRRACQDADYGPPGAAPSSAERSHAAR
ncbi:MAG TPA: hypothetical protein VF405_11705 [Gammaproteobacteria bacterium]